MDDCNSIILRPNIFRSSERQIIKVTRRATIAEIIDSEDVQKVFGGAEITAAVNGKIIPAGQLGRRLAEGEFLALAPRVGEDDGKTILNVVLMVVISAAAGGLTSGLTYFSVLGVEVGVGALNIALIVGGAMLISALTPRPSAPSKAFLDEEQSQFFGWAPATVQRAGIPLPRFYGLNKLYGNVIAAHTEKESDTWEMTTITEVFYYDMQGNRTFRYNPWGAKKAYSYSQVLTPFDPRKVNLYALFCLGIGPMREPVVAGTLNLNDQLIENLSSVYYEQRPGDIIQQPVSYFNKTRLEAMVSRTVKSGSPVTYTTKNKNFNDLEIELAFPKGLYNASAGDLANYTVNVTVEIKKTTSSTWTLLADGADITDNVADKVIVTYTTVDTFAVEYGSNYDVRVTKNTADADNIKYGDELYLDKVREIIDSHFTYPRMSLVGVKALATDQLSGSIRFSVLSRGLYVRLYSDGSGGTNIGYSNNPADVIADILTQPVYTGSHSPWLDLKLLLNFEGADGATTMIDDSPRGHSVTFAGDAQLDTAEQKFGSASGLVDGVGDYWQIAQDNDSFDLWENLVEDWTLDFEIKMGDHAGIEVVCGQYQDASNYWYIFHEHGAGFTFRLRVNGVTEIDITGMGEIADNNWYHIALIKVAAEIGFYRANAQLGYALMDSDMIKNFDSDFYIGQAGDSASYLYANMDHFRIIQSNIFSAAPVTGLTDTITEPAAAYTDPGNSYAVARYDGYNPSKLLTADFEDLADWCDDDQTNPVNFAISSISQATNAVVVTLSNHNFKVGDVILFRNVDDNGMIEIADETTATVTKITSETSFTVDLDTSGYTAFFSGLKLLLNFEGDDGSVDFYDESPYDATVIYTTGCVIDTAQSALGSSSLYVPALYAKEIRFADSDNWDLIGSAADNWAVSFFVRFDGALPGYNQPLMQQAESVNDYWAIEILGTGGDDSEIRFQAETGGGVIITLQTAGGLISADTWHHIALCKVADEYGIYLDGVQKAYVQDVSTDTYSYLLQIGRNSGGFEAKWMDAVMIRNDNYYSAAPVVGLTDTITVPTTSPTPITPTVEQYQPRFSFNGGFDTEDNMWSAALKVCEQCRCIPYWDGDTIRIAIDKSATPVYAFTMGNIIRGSYKESWIPVAERAGEIEIHYRDRNRDYERVPFTVINSAITSTTSKTRLDMFGLTDEETAERLADYRLLLNRYIKKMASWTADVEAIACSIGDVVEVQHDATNYGRIGSGADKATGGGRIIAATNITNAVISIRGSFKLPKADFDGGNRTYKLLTQGGDHPPESLQITGLAASSVTGADWDITVSGTYTQAPKRDWVWAAGLAAYESQKYRIINLRQKNNQQVEVTGLQYVEAVYAND